MSRFNAPPGWPKPPEGWVPPENWKPDSSWPPPPPGWQFWIENRPDPPREQVSPRASAESHSAPARGGLFGGKKRLEAENAELRAALERTGGMTTVALEEERRTLEATIEARQREAEHIRVELAQLRASVVETEEIAMLQEAGIYQYAHPLDTAAGYKDLLARVRADTKSMVKAGNAVLATSSWQVNGSAAQGRVMVRDFSKCFYVHTTLRRTIACAR